MPERPHTSIELRRDTLNVSPAASPCFVCCTPRVLVIEHGASHLQRAFSSFPSGSVGIALLVLRVVVGACAAIEAGSVLTGSHAAVRLATIAAAAMVIAGLALIVGLLTPIASALLCVGGTGIMLTCVPPAPLLLFDSEMAVFEFVVMSAALVALGPGGISLDAHLFGRRRVVLREAPGENDS